MSFALEILSRPLQLLSKGMQLMGRSLELLSKRNTAEFAVPGCEWLRSLLGCQRDETDNRMMFCPII